MQNGTQFCISGVVLGNKHEENSLSRFTCCHCTSCLQIMALQVGRRSSHQPGRWWRSHTQRHLGSSVGLAEDACGWEMANGGLQCRRHPVFSLEFRASQRSGRKMPTWNSNPGLVAGDWPRLCCLRALLPPRAVGSCPGERGLVAEIRRKSCCLLVMEDEDTRSANPEGLQ